MKEGGLFMEQQAMIAMALSLAAGLATGIGGLVVCFLKVPTRRLLSIGLGFSGGVMVAVSLMDLLPEAFSACMVPMGKVVGGFYAIVVMAIGMLLAALIETFVPERPNFLGSEERGSVYRIGILSVLVVVLHNMPEGVATFLSSYKDLSIGIPIAAAIALHNIPEGIAISVPLFYSTGKRMKAFSYSLLSGLSEPLGAVIAFFLLKNFVDEFILGMLYALIAGIMLFISLDKLLPSAWTYGSRKASILSTACGIALMCCVLVLT